MLEHFRVKIYPDERKKLVSKLTKIFLIESYPEKKKMSENQNKK
jgi:hypothetical protein